jgi:hypothetical protein
MKFKDWAVAFTLTLIVILIFKYNSLALQNQQQITVLQSDIKKLQQQVTECVTVDDLQPLLDDLAKYEDNTDYLMGFAVEVWRKNKDWAERWDKYFGAYNREVLGEWKRAIQ